MNVVETLTVLEQHPELHAARLLLLLDTFSGEDGSGAIQGLTKLAKLDFLLRYPVMLERALQAKGHSIREVHTKEYERKNVESKMIRYRFGPWDHRYREYLNILVAKGLASISIEGRTIVLSATQNGREYAARLSLIEDFNQYTQRAKLLKRHFDLTATNLMRFIYDTFPEIVSLRPNTPIST